jgi:hypothetical protein
LRALAITVRVIGWVRRLLQSSGGLWVLPGMTGLELIDALRRVGQAYRPVGPVSHSR